MKTTLDVHLEKVSDEAPHFAWWAETPAVENLSIAADHLPELLNRARAAIAEITGTPPEEVELEIRFVRDEDHPDVRPSQGLGDQDPADRRGVELLAGAA